MKYFLTRFGDISYSRTRYQDRDGKARYLLDESLCIKKNQRISLSRARIECFLASLSSYREVANQVKLLVSNSRSHEYILKGIITEARLIIEQQKKRLCQTEDLANPEKEVSPTAYLEADPTFVKLQQKGAEREKKLEVKVGVGYTGKEDRYKSGFSQRLKEKFTYVGIRRNFMHQFSFKAEQELAVSQSPLS
ncbi:MAG: UPF0236 family protein [Candidatus Atribacteria bacterium]|nr:UPF0236 family protein [Candidatus Atribacteria bacterium]